MGGGARAVLLLHSFFQVTEFNKLGVKLLVLSALKREEEVKHWLWRGKGREGSPEDFAMEKTRFDFLRGQKNLDATFF